MHNIVFSVFEDFIAVLGSKGIVDNTAIERLRSTLLEEQELTADALRRALLWEDPLQ